jgi:hypothetical protein
MRMVDDLLAILAKASDESETSSVSEGRGGILVAIWHVKWQSWSAKRECRRQTRSGNAAKCVGRLVGW